MPPPVNSPIEGDKIHEARNYIRNGKNGLETVLEFNEVILGTDLLALAGYGPSASKATYRGRAQVTVKIPELNGQPAQEGQQPVDFKIDAANIQEAFNGYEAGLQRAQKEVQEDVNQQVAAMKLRMGAGQGRGILKPN